MCRIINQVLGVIPRPYRHNIMLNREPEERNASYQISALSEMSISLALMSQIRENLPKECAVSAIINLYSS